MRGAWKTIPGVEIVRAGEHGAEARWVPRAGAVGTDAVGELRLARASLPPGGVEAGQVGRLEFHVVNQRPLWRFVVESGGNPSPGPGPGPVNRPDTPGWAPAGGSINMDMTQRVIDARQALFEARRDDAEDITGEVSDATDCEEWLQARHSGAAIEVEWGGDFDDVAVYSLETGGELTYAIAADDEGDGFQVLIVLIEDPDEALAALGGGDE